MNGVLGYTSLLLESELDPEQKSYVNTIQNSGQTLLSLINDILDFSKIEAGKVKIEKTPFILRTRIEEALNAIAEKATRKNVDLSYHIGSNVPIALEGDPVRVQQILTNLLDNAVKFTEQGGVSLFVESVPLNATGEHIISFQVQDTGIGIDPGRLETIFDSFTQADSSTTRRYGGTGLGLAISNRLSKMMGGEIVVDSEPDEGSTFHCTIKISESRDPQFITRFAPPLPDFEEKRGLIASANLTRRAHVASMCRSANMNVLTADSAEGVLMLLKLGKKFDVIILDHHETRLDHFELTRVIRQRGFEQIVILLSSRNSTRSDSSVRIDAVIPRPVKRTTLFNVLAKNLHSPKTSYITTAAPNFNSSLGKTHPLNILIAEDDKLNRELANLIFARMGYSPDIVSNGKEVVEAVSQKPYDVIFMDVYMPEMDGLEATRTIHERLDRTSRPRIIAMTASVTAHDRRRCEEAHMDGFIGKPIDIEQLTQALKSVKKPIVAQGLVN